MLLAQSLKPVKQSVDSLSNMPDLVTHKELEVNKHLIIARTAGMNLFANVTKPGCEHELHFGMHILNTLLYHKVATLYNIGNILKSLDKQVKLIFFQQPYALKHTYMSHRALHIVARKAQIKLAVTTHSKFLYHSVRLEAFAPKFHIIISFSMLL